MPFIQVIVHFVYQHHMALNFTYNLKTGQQVTRHGLLPNTKLLRVFHLSLEQTHDRQSAMHKAHGLSQGRLHVYGTTVYTMYLQLHTLQNIDYQYGNNNSSNVSLKLSQLS